MKLSSNQIEQIFTWARRFKTPDPEFPMRLEICVEECYDDDRANFTLHVAKDRKLPSAADLDAVAAEEQIAQATA